MTLRAAAEQALAELRAAIAKHTDWGESLHTGIYNAVEKLDAALAAEQPQPEADERAENEALRREMADILTRTANALRGPPGPREAWGWADLPERAEAAIAAITTMTLAAKHAAAPPPAAPEPSEAEVEAAFIALHGAPSDYMFTAAMRVDAKARVRDALRAAAAARKA